MRQQGLATRGKEIWKVYLQRTKGPGDFNSLILAPLDRYWQQVRLIQLCDFEVAVLP